RRVSGDGRPAQVWRRRTRYDCDGGAAMKLSQLIDAMINEALDDVHTAIPARVEKFNPQTLRGEVVPLVKRKLEQDGEPEALPPILDVPFQMPKAGPFIIHF